MDRTILHCDLNSYFASVECLYNPKLKNVPMAVCGNPEARKGIVLAKNELAKSFGVKTAETIWQARLKCPDLVLVSPHFSRYAKYSKLVNSIYQQYSDRVEPFGIDESWLDVTNTKHLFGSGKQIADTLRERIKSELGLTISVGVSFNKIFAKLGSDYKKPDATTVITKDTYKNIVWPLSVDCLLFVGNKSKTTLKRLGINTIGDLASFDKGALKSALSMSGEILHDYANGLDNSPVAYYYEKSEAKSVGNGMTYKRNLLGESDIKTALIGLSDIVSYRLRNIGMAASTLQLKIKTPELKTVNRQKALSEPSNIASELFGHSFEIIKDFWDFTKPIRMLTLTATGLIKAYNANQLNMFNEETERRLKSEKLQSAMDSIRARFGKDAVTYAPIIGNDLGITQDKDLDD